jgi:hypothetical protein
MNSYSPLSCAAIHHYTRACIVLPTLPTPLCTMWPKFCLCMLLFSYARSHYFLVPSTLSNGEQRCLSYLSIKGDNFHIYPKMFFSSMKSSLISYEEKNFCAKWEFFCFLHSILNYVYTKHILENRPVILFLARRSFRIVGNPPLTTTPNHTPFLNFSRLCVFFAVPLLSPAAFRSLADDLLREVVSHLFLFSSLQN